MSESSENYVLFEKSAGTATVTLNRPNERNSFNDEVIAGLADAFKMAADFHDVRVVLLRGAGKVFSAGADLGWMKKAASLTEQENREDALKMAAMFEALYYCPKPTVAVVHGAAMGGAMGLIAACDIAIATDSTKFAFTEVLLGLAPAVIAPFVIAKIGSANASRYFLTGEIFDAETALKIGLVSKVVTDAHLHDASIELATQLKKGSPTAQSEIKRLVSMASGFSPVEYREYTSKLIASLRAGEEGKEGLSSFFEKRLPKWAAAAGDKSGGG